jgi:hypothetical protein
MIQHAGGKRKVSIFYFKKKIYKILSLFIKIVKNFKQEECQAPVVHACNPSYLGG